MAGRQTLGEAFSKPYESVTRAGGNLSRSRMNDQRSLQMPEEQRRRDYMTQIRSQLIQHQMKMAEGRLGLMGQGQNQRGQEFLQKLEEQKREFDEGMGYKNKALDMGVGVGAGRQPAYLKAFLDAQKAAERAGALNPDGSVDMDKLAQNPQLAEEYKLGMQYGNKLANTTQNINRSTSADIMEQTLSVMDPDKLTEAFDHYSGFFGPEKYTADSAKAASGAKMPQYFHDYQTYLATKPLAGEQIRNFYGSSVTPENMKKMDSILGQDDRRLSGAQRKENLKTIFSILGAEAATLKAKNLNPQDVRAVQENKAKQSALGNLSLAGGHPEVQGISGRSGKQYSTQEIQALMDKYGLTKEEVLDGLKRTG